jgi:hypothetical protein
MADDWRDQCVNHLRQTFPDDGELVEVFVAAVDAELPDGLAWGTWGETVYARAHAATPLA